MIEVVMPDLAEGSAEATINSWYFEEGDSVSKGDNLAEVVTDAGTFHIPAPVTGVLDEVFFEPGDDVEVGEVIATIEPE